MPDARRIRCDRGAPAGALCAVIAGLLIAPAPGSGVPAPGRDEPERREERRPPAGADLDAPTPAWREGPVRYLLSQDEDQAYRRLESDEERARFITRFWAARDPDPTTPENEYRDLFLRRVEAASRLFRLESTKPGWKTDRGKIYILLGPPDDLTQSSVRPRSAEIITWTYREPPPGTDASPNSQVHFVRDPSGEYRLTVGIRSFPTDTALSRALALQAMQMKSLPGTHAVPGDDAAPAPPGAPAPLRLHAGFFRAGNGRTLVVLTVWAQEILFASGRGDGREGGPPAAAAFKEAVARLAAAGGEGGSPGEPGGSTVLRTAEDPRVRGPDGSRVFQGGLVVRPGEYQAEVALVAADASTIHSLGRRLAVPDFEIGALAIGPITFASHLERLDTSPWPEYTAPFLLGRLRVVPRYDSQFRAGEELAFYYQVLGASTDPIEGLPDFDLEYRFLIDGGPAGGQDRALPFGHPIHLTREQNHVQGFSLPLAGWSPGAYRLEVTVTDNLTGGTARAGVPFQVR